MPTDPDTKVFDVAKPAQTAPDTTSRPIIIGHHPQVSDPMVNSDRVNENVPHRVTPIHVGMDEDDDQQINIHAPTPFVEHHVEPASYTQQSDVPLEALPPQSSFEPNAAYDDGSSNHGPHPLQMAHGAGPRRRWPKVLAWLVVVLILAAVAGYLAIDAGLVKSNLNLPFHIFNQQKMSQTSSTISNPKPAAANPAPALSTAPAVPAGFTAYRLSGTNISFDYPTAWGTPAVQTDPGFSSRAKAAKSDGTYAFLVNFASNKDVQISLTSAKDLPQARPPLYYDYLQWCVGTNDGLFYKQSMHITTANGADKPANVVCDQGPLTDATKINSQTIVQLKAKDASGATLGDLYTLNLTDSTYSVLHVKDATMANGVNIKTLLTTVKN